MWSNSSTARMCEIFHPLVKLFGLIILFPWWVVSHPCVPPETTANMKESTNVLIPHVRWSAVNLTVVIVLCSMIYTHYYSHDMISLPDKYPYGLGSLVLIQSSFLSKLQCEIYFRLLLNPSTFSVELQTSDGELSASTKFLHLFVCLFVCLNMALYRLIAQFNQCF